MTTFEIPDDLIEHVSFSGVVVQRMIQAGSAAALTEAAATIKTLQDAAKEQARAYDVLSTDSGALLRENREFSARIDVLTDQLKQRDALVANLKMQLVEALKGTPPPVIEPVPPAPPVVPVMPLKPIITKTRFENVIIGCIVKSGDAGTEDALVREVIDKSVELGCNSVTAWFHPTAEVAEFLKPENVNNPLKNTFKYAADRGVIIGADTIDAALRIIKETPTDEVFNKYVDSLIALGAKYLLWNDVDGIHEGKRVYTPEYIKAGMARITKALKEHPNIPVIASLTAGANLNDYRTVYGFDLVEIQTDGNLTELVNFMKLNADVFALFVEQDKSLDYLRNARPLVVNSSAKAIRIYAIYDGDTDFRKPIMDTRAVEVKETIRQFTATRLVKAQPA